MRRLSKHFQVLFATALPILLGLISVHFILKNYGESLFAIFNIVLAGFAFISILDLGMSRILSQMVAEKYNFNDLSLFPIRDNDVNRILSIVLAFSIFITLILITVFLLAGQQALHLDPDKFKMLFSPVIFTLLSIPFIVLISVLKGALEGLHEFKSSNHIQIFNSVLIYIIPCAFSFLTKDLYWPFLIIFLSRGLLLFYTFLKLKNFFIFNFDWNIKSSQRKICDGLWISLAALVSPVLLYSDRIIMAGRLSLDLIAPYTTAIDTILRALVIPQALSRLMLPEFTRNLESLNVMKQKINLYILLFFGLVVLPLFILNYFGLPLLKIWLNPIFGEKVNQFIPWLSYAIANNSFSWITYNLLQAKKLFKPLFWAQFISALIYLILLINFVSIKPIYIVQLWSIRLVFDSIILNLILKHYAPLINLRNIILSHLLILTLWVPSLLNF